MNAAIECVIAARSGGYGCSESRAPEQVKVVEKILDEREPRMGMARGIVGLLLALESPRGLFNAYAARYSVRVIVDTVT